MAYQVNGYIKRTDTGQGVEGLNVKAWDADAGLNLADNLGSDVTDANGYYEIDYTKDKMGWEWGSADIVIEVFDKWDDSIHNSGVVKQDAPASFTVPDILITPELLGDFTVKGRVLRTDTSEGIEGLRIAAHDQDIPLREKLGEDTTNENGYYQIDFTKRKFHGVFGEPGGRPDIVIEVFNYKDDEVYESQIFQDAPVISTVPDILIPPEDLFGEYYVSGTIRDMVSSNELSDLLVEAYDKDIRYDDKLIEVCTNSQGKYEFGFNHADYSLLFLDGPPDIFLQVKTSEGFVLGTSKTYKMPSNTKSMKIDLDVYTDHVQNQVDVMIVRETKQNIKNEIKESQRTTKHAVTFNPVDNNIRYEFMITPEGVSTPEGDEEVVIYNKNNEEEWFYFGVFGWNYDKERVGEAINIPAVSMIAADGNRVLVKDKKTNKMYFAVMVLDEKPHGGFYIREDPAKNLAYLIPPPKSEQEHSDAVSKYKIFGLSLYIPRTWMVAVDKPCTWYKIDKVFYKENETVVDIGVVNIHRDQGGYQPIYGGEYHRPLPDKNLILPVRLPVFLLLLAAI